LGNMGTKTRYLISYLPSNTYYCSIQAIDNCFVASPFSEEIMIQIATSVEDNAVAMPITTFLGKNYPNPFNAATRIGLGLKENDKVEIKIYNIKGQAIRTLVDERMNAGYHAVLWDGSDEDNNTVPSGTYFVEMNAGEYRASIKVLLIR
ncbi:T9SS type A sorting domain-containing protein, partial [candidate division KSB1 bacterium]|nr:T9SS type A sorting domain-containing protein [candidate division KSB1 bacterium]